MQNLARNASPQLMDALGYTDKDLSHNRQLKLSERQKNLIKNTIALHLMISGYGAICCFMVAAATLFSEFAFSKFLFETLLTLAGFAIFTFWLFYILSWNNKINRYSGVKMIEGKPEFGELCLGFKIMKIGKSRFYITDRAQSAIAPGNIRVYYFQTILKRVLSIENVE